MHVSQCVTAFNAVVSAWLYFKSQILSYSRELHRHTTAAEGATGVPGALAGGVLTQKSPELSGVQRWSGLPDGAPLPHHVTRGPLGAGSCPGSACLRPVPGPGTERVLRPGGVSGVAPCYSMREPQGDRKAWTSCRPLPEATPMPCAELAAIPSGFKTLLRTVLVPSKHTGAACVGGKARFLSLRAFPSVPLPVTPRKCADCPGAHPHRAPPLTVGTGRRARLCGTFRNGTAAAGVQGPE